MTATTRSCSAVTSRPPSTSPSISRELGSKTVIVAVTGTLSPAQRIERIEQLAEAAAETGARRVLVATDCLSEGVNLQHHFDAVVHYDLAWNPTRHEQREGRVDRFGQRPADVRVVTLYGADNGIDGKVLDVLIRKHREIRKTTGISVPVPGETGGGDRRRRRGAARRDSDGRQQACSTSGRLPGSRHRTSTPSGTPRPNGSGVPGPYAQHTIRPDDVALEVAAIRDALGAAGEIHFFTRTACGPSVPTSPSPPRRLHRTTSTLPAGLRDDLAVVAGERPAIPFRTTRRPTGRGSPHPHRPVRRRPRALRPVRRSRRGHPARDRPARAAASSAPTPSPGAPRCSWFATASSSPCPPVRRPATRRRGRPGARLRGSAGHRDWLPDEEAATLLAVRPDANTATEFAEDASAACSKGCPR